jgi:hypothetical protein
MKGLIIFTTLAARMKAFHGPSHDGSFERVPILWRHGPKVEAAGVRAESVQALGTVSSSQEDDLGLRAM